MKNGPERTENEMFVTRRQTVLDHLPRTTWSLHRQLTGRDRYDRYDRYTGGG